MSSAGLFTWLFLLIFNKKVQNMLRKRFRHSMGSQAVFEKAEKMSFVVVYHFAQISEQHQRSSEKIVVGSFHEQCVRRFWQRRVP